MTAFDGIGDAVVCSIALVAILGASTSPAGAEPATGAAPLTSAGTGPSAYHVKMRSVAPPRLAITASLPIDGRALEMETTRPAGIPELDDRGWPGLVSNLRVSDSTGRPVAVAPAGEAGWLLAEAHAGRLTVDYEVDYSPLAARGWPAPREAALADSSHLVFIGRSMFITTRDVGSTIVTFALPRRYRPVTPWEQSPGSAHEFAVGTKGGLVENIVVLTRSGPDVLNAGGFRLLVTPMGHWLPARKEVRRVLGAVMPRLVGLMGFEERENYLVVLLPVVDSGGESFRSSFALTMDDPPSRANSSTWGRLLAHEIFHYWNGGRLRGSDYVTSQWFQEGFTEYVANVSMVAAKLAGPEDFTRTLSDHVRNYRNLTTTLEAGGSPKGPPLYSGGALVAFSWDVSIRHSTDGKRDLGDFLRALWQLTERGERSCDWREIRAALEATAPRDWDAYFRSYIRGDEPLPLDETLLLAGLLLEQAEDGTPRIKVNPEASAPSNSLWRALVEGR